MITAINVKKFRDWIEEKVKDGTISEERLEATLFVLGFYLGEKDMQNSSRRETS